MEYRIFFDDGSNAVLSHSALSPEEVARRRYAFPEQRKFPLTDRAHVLSAIKFFNYVDPKDEAHLARAILKRMRELGMTEVNVGEANRFRRYYEKATDGYSGDERDDEPAALKHHGVLGMKWGVRNAETKARYARDGKSSGISIDPHKVAVGAAVVGGVLAVAGGVYIAKATGVLGPASYGYAVMSTAPLKDFVGKMDDTPVTLKAGAKMQRISGQRVEDLKAKGELYVSYKLRDNARYADRLPGEAWLRGRPAYKQTLIAAREIKAPSRKEAAEIYLQVAGSDASQIDFQRFMSQGIRTARNGETNPLRAPYLAELKKRGYNAVIDENDANWTNKPLILIDPEELVGKAKGRKMTPVDKVVATYLK